MKDVHVQATGEAPALKREHLTPQNSLLFFSFFCWGSIFAHPVPDPGNKTNADPQHSQHQNPGCTTVPSPFPNNIFARLVCQVCQGWE